MPLNTANYNLTLYDRTADENQQFISFREDIAGTIASSNMNKIDNQMKINADAINDLAGAGRTTETTKLNADNIEQLRNKIIHEVVATGTDTYTGTGTTVNSYYSGQKILLKVANDNTSNSTLNINGLGAKSLKKIENGIEIELSSGNIKQNQPQFFEYNGSSWIAIGNLGTGDMLESIYDPSNIQGNTFDMSNMINGGLKKVGNGYALDNSSNRPTLGENAVDLSYTTDNTKGASGNYSYTEGFETKASGYGSYAGGYDTTASGNYSWAYGYYTKANGFLSHAQNFNTIAQGHGQTAIGRYNIVQGNIVDYVNTDYAFIIGNGSDNINRSNALTVNWQGDLWSAGDIFSNGNTVWHAGNFDPTDYLPLTGGTVTGDLGVKDWIIQEDTSSGSLKFVYNG